MPTAQGYIRAFLFAADIDEAQARARPLAAQLNTVAQVTTLRLERYWKIPEYWEALCDLEAFDLPALKTALAPDWAHETEDEAIWDHLTCPLPDPSI